MRKKIVCKNVQKFQLLDICRERSKRSLWISFHFAICTSDIMPLPYPFQIIFRYGACPSVKTIRREFGQKYEVLSVILEYPVLVFIISISIIIIVVQSLYYFLQRIGADAEQVADLHPELKSPPWHKQDIW